MLAHVPQGLVAPQRQHPADSREVLRDRGDRGRHQFGPDDLLGDRVAVAFELIEVHQAWPTATPTADTSTPPSVTCSSEERSETFRYRLRTQAMTSSSQDTTT